MPELPEMENYRLLLSNLILNQIITNVEINREKSVNIPAESFINEIRHYQILKIDRRAKYLLFLLDTDKVLLLHLMLNGWMFYGKESEKPDRTVQVKLSFGDRHLFFIGLRLGYLHLLTKQETVDKLQKLGSEPLDPQFTFLRFQQMLSKKSGMLKTALTDQDFISGIGNYYSDEICFEAGLLPMRQGKELKQPEIEHLFNSILSVLKKATQFGGYMESRLHASDNKTGNYDPKRKVYDREGEPCLRCGNPIIKDIVSSRKAFYCPVCQH